MAGRIRSIKPELPMSESLGRVSRDARLLFILLFTVSDDAGRFRASSRILASQLYPSDVHPDSEVKTTPAQVDEWLDELERQRCVQLYVVDGSRYGRIIKWLAHQKIDKPSAPKFPGPELADGVNRDEQSRALASPRETSTTEGKGGEGEGEGKGEDARETPQVLTIAHQITVPSVPRETPTGGENQDVQRIIDRVEQAFRWNSDRARVHGFVGDARTIQAWAQDGLAPEEILDAIDTIARRKPDLCAGGKNPWAYLDSAVPNIIAEGRRRKASQQSGETADWAPRQLYHGCTAGVWRMRVREWRKDPTTWRQSYGCPPDDPRTNTPKIVLDEFGLPGPENTSVAV